MASALRPLVLLLCVSTSTALADDALPSAEELALHLRQYQSSIKTLRVRYRTRQLPMTSTDGVVNPGFPWREYVWIKDGPREYLGQLPGEGPETGDIATTGDGKFLAGYDGKAGYKAVYFQTDPETLRSVVVTDEKPSRLTVPFPRLLGWEFPIVADTLITLLERPGAKPVEWEEIDSHRCAHVRLGTISEGLSSEHNVQVWFDPEFDWLPRFIQILPTPIHEAFEAGEKPPKPVSPYILHTPKVKQFVRATDDLTGRTRWFPGGLNQPALEEDERQPILEVIEASINRPVDRNLFKPEMPEGTEIIKNMNTARQTREYVGGDAGEDLFVNRRDEDSRQRMGVDVLPKDRPASSVDEIIAVSGRPQTESHVARWLLIVALFSAAAAFFAKKVV